MTGKTDAPPPLPHETLDRVCRLARFEGRSLLVLAGLFSLLAAYQRDGIGAVAGCLAAAVGVIELNGVNRLRQASVSGLSWIIGSQIALLLTVLAYAILRATTFDPVTVARLITTETRAEFAELGLREDQILPMLEKSYVGVYVTVALVSVVYQGGMALYYHRRRDAVRRALEDV
jgi:hypothetical protein